jgi:hypothetical protein
MFENSNWMARAPSAAVRLRRTTPRRDCRDKAGVSQEELAGHARPQDWGQHIDPMGKSWEYVSILLSSGPCGEFPWPLATPKARAVNE